jgi:hypothetical protein
MKTPAGSRPGVQNIDRARRGSRPIIPVDDVEAAALFLVEHMRPAIRAELGRLLVANSGEPAKVR